MNGLRILTIAFAGLLFSYGSFVPGTVLADETARDDVSIKAVAETGFLAPLAHSIQFGKSGSRIDYVEEGGQDNLYFTGRASLEMELSNRHTFIFMYQPLSLSTVEEARRDLVVDDLTFTKGTPVRFTYDFPFYRFSYLYDFLTDPRFEFALGVSLQIRNAAINFESLDGTQLRSNRNIGPVPVLKLRAKYTFDSGFWLGTEMDGFYAPVSYLNGDDNEVVGAILDASIRGGVAINSFSDLFLNVRYLGGGAEGTSDNDKVGDGYNKNWLHFLTVTAGFELKLR